MQQRVKEESKQKMFLLQSEDSNTSFRNLPRPTWTSWSHLLRVIQSHWFVAWRFTLLPRSTTGKHMHSFHPVIRLFMDESNFLWSIWAANWHHCDQVSWFHQFPAEVSVLSNSKHRILYENFNQHFISPKNCVSRCNMCDRGSHYLLVGSLAAFIWPISLSESNSSATEIYNGTIVPLDDYEYFANVFSNFGDRKIYCSGALLDKQWVITAASCLAERKSNLGLYFRETDRRIIKPGGIGQGVPIENILHHPKFQALSSQNESLESFNFALLQLMEENSAPEKYASLPRLGSESKFIHTQTPMNILAGGECSVISSNNIETTFKVATADFSVRACYHQAKYYTSWPYQLCTPVPPRHHLHICPDDVGSPVIFETRSNNSSIHVASAIVTSIQEGCDDSTDPAHLPCMIQLIHLAPHTPMILYLIDKTGIFSLTLQEKMDEWMANPVIMSRFFSWGSSDRENLHPLLPQADFAWIHATLLAVCRIATRRVQFHRDSLPPQLVAWSWWRDGDRRETSTRTRRMPRPLSRVAFSLFIRFLSPALLIAQVQHLASSGMAEDRLSMHHM